MTDDSKPNTGGYLEIEFPPIQFVRVVIPIPKRWDYVSTTRKTFLVKDPLKDFVD